MNLTTRITFLLILFTTLSTIVEPSEAKGLQVEEINSEKAVDFQEEILPILRNNCLPCHNQTRAKADVVLETPQDILKGNDDGPLAVPGKPEESYLFQVSAHLEEPEMPPLKNKVSAKSLTPRELGLLKLWIQQGVKGELRNAKPIDWQPILTSINNPIYAVALSPDGQFVATGRANRIDLYHIPSETLVGELTDENLKSGNFYKQKPAHLDFVTSLAFSPDGRNLVSGSYREIKFWKLQTIKPQKEFNLPIADAPVTISPDGKWLAMADDMTVQIWDLKMGKKVRNLDNQKAKISSLAFSSDSQKLLSGTVDGTLHSWNVEDGKPVAKAQINDKPITSVAYIAEGKRLISGHDDKVIRTWEARTEEEIKKIQLARDESMMALEVVKKEIQAAEKMAFEAEKTRKDAEMALQQAENALDAAEEKKGEDKSTLNKAQTFLLEAKKDLVDKTTLATKTKANAEQFKTEKLEPAKKKLSETQLALNHSGAFKMVRELKGHGQVVSHLSAVASNANQILSASADGQAILWDTATGSSPRKFSHGKPISSISIRPDGKQFVTTGGTTLRLWAENGQQVTEAKGNRYDAEKAANTLIEASFADGELKYREGELKKREDEKKKADERLKKANEAKEKAAKEPVDEKKAELAKQEKVRNELEKTIELTSKAVKEAQQKSEQDEKLRKDAEIAYKAAVAKAKQPILLEMQANQAREQKKKLSDDKKRALDNITNSQIKPTKQKLDKAKLAFAEAESKLKDFNTAHKAITNEVKQAKLKRETAEKAAMEAGTAAKNIQEDPSKPEPEKQKAMKTAELKRKIANDSKIAHESLVNSKLNQSKQNLDAAQKSLPIIKARKEAAEKAMMAVEKKFNAAQSVSIAANKTLKESEHKATSAKILADKVRATNEATKKILDEKSKSAVQSKTSIEKLKKEKQEPEKKKLADLQKKIDALRKEFDKINGPLQTAIRELENASLDLERAKGEVDKANKLKATAEQVKKKREMARDSAKEATSASEKNITSVAFAPDGKSFATSGDDNRIHTWGTDKGQPFEVFGKLSQSSRLITYTPEGSIISIARDGKVTSWQSTPKWKLEKSIGSAVGESPIIDRVTSLDYSPDGKTLASGGGEPSRSGEVLLWNVVDAKLKLNLSGIHSDSVLDIDFSPDGKHIATAAADKFVKVTETSKGSVVRTFEGHTHHVMGVSWRRTGREILSSGADKDVKYWNFENGDRMGKGGGFQKEVTSIHYIGISSEAIATSAEGKVSVIRSGSKISQATALSGATKFVHASDVTPDGKLVAAGGQDGILRIWTIKDKKLYREFKPPETEGTTVADVK